MPSGPGLTKFLLANPNPRGITILFKVWHRSENKSKQNWRNPIRCGGGNKVSIDGGICPVVILFFMGLLISV